MRQTRSRDEHEMSCVYTSSHTEVYVVVVMCVVCVCHPTNTVDDAIVIENMSHRFTLYVEYIIICSCSLFMAKRYQLASSSNTRPSPKTSLGILVGLCPFGHAQACSSDGKILCQFITTWTQRIQRWWKRRNEKNIQTSTRSSSSNIPATVRPNKFPMVWIQRLSAHRQLSKWESEWNALAWRQATIETK